jgi:calmodulin|tara:strand:+ start:278 stop:799 length:522 start_codon:yes stop_codon:yes gene_type:complete
MADAPPAIPEITEEELAKRKKKIEDAFALFDKEGKGCLIQEEVSTVMRYLGAFPRERDVVETVLPDMMEDEPTAFVTYEKFEKKMLEVMAQNLYEADTDDIMLAAFKAIDTDGKGYIDADRMRELLSTYGTAFRPKEIDGFMSRAKDMETGRIYYEDYIAMFLGEIEEMENQE